MAGRHRTCEICGIKEKHSIEKLFFARFPLDKDRCVEWLKVVGKEDLVYLPIDKLHDLRYVCEIHFTKRDFTKSKTRLKKSAVPTLHLTSAQLTDNLIAEFLQLNSLMSEQSVPASTAPAASTAVEQELAASTSQSTGVLGISPVNVQSVDEQAVSARTAPVSLTAIEPRPGVSTSLSTGVLGRSPVNVQTVSQQAVPVSTTLAANKETAAPMSQSISVLVMTSVKIPAVIPTPKQPGITEATEIVLKRKGPVNQATKRKLDDEIDESHEPRKKQLLMQLTKTKCTLGSLKKSATLIENLSSTVLKDLVLSALENQKRKPKGKRWTLKNKISALAILKRSPKAYRYMEHIMPLPRIQTLQKILKKIPMEPGINPDVINHLKKIANTFTQKDKLCTLAFGKMVLKERLAYNEATDKVDGFVDTGTERKGELANQALVFMLQGLRKKIKQPVALYFVKRSISAEKLADLITVVIKEIHSTGFNIIATICDQGRTNFGALRLLRENKGEDNYFEMDNKKIFFIFDVPHLFKSIRNNFLKQGEIKIEERTGKWSHIMEVEEQNRSFLHLSKITPTHVQPKYRAKMRVKYAAQILSQTVAAVLKLFAEWVENEHRSEEILQTALIVEDLNKLFDFTNGPSSSDDVKKGIRENVSAKSNHVRVWSEFRHKLSTLKFVGENGAKAINFRCIQGYIITLKSLADVWNLLKGTGYKHLNLRQLNQDALENLFGVIRQHNSTNNHLTCSTFMAALRTTVISGMKAPHRRGFNCEKDNKLLLTNFHKELSENKEEITTDDENEEISIECVDKPAVLSLPDSLEEMELESDLTQIKEQPLVYVSGYIASRMTKKTKCIHCKNSLTVDDPLDNPVYELIKLKEWWQDKQNLTYPSFNLCQMVEKAVQIFESEGIPNFQYDSICQWMVTLFHTNCNTAWLQCNAHAESITHEMHSTLALLLVRRQCQRVNYSETVKEEDLADA